MAYIGPEVVTEIHGQFTKQTLTPNGAKTTFTLDNEVASASSIRVVYGGVPQEPGLAYTVAGNTITFTFVPNTGIILYVIYLNDKVPIGVPGDGTITEAKLDTNAVLRGGYIHGLQLGNNVTNPTNDIDIGIGECVSEDGTTNMVLSSALIKQINATWLAGTNQGGFPSGLTGGLVQDDTWYHIFVIKDTNSGVVDVGFDASLTATNLLNTSTYDKYRRIGSVRRETASNNQFFQIGNRFMYDTPISDLNGVPPTTRTLQTISVPTGINVEADITYYVRVTDNGEHYCLIYNPLLADTPPSQSLHTMSARDFSSIDMDHSNKLLVTTDTSSRIAERVSGTINNRRIICHGYIDNRGQL